MVASTTSTAPNKAMNPRAIGASDVAEFVGNVAFEQGHHGARLIAQPFGGRSNDRRSQDVRFTATAADRRFA